MTPGQTVSRDDLNALLCSIAPNAQVDDEYDHFVQPEEGAIKYLTSKYWDPLVFDYGSIAPDWPLCYDFANVAAAEIIKAAYRENWPYRPAFGVLRYTKTIPGQRHAINFAALDNCHLIYFEPQTGEWMDQPKDLQSMDNLYI